MRVCITGGREYNDIKTLSFVLDLLNDNHPFTEFVTGMARGADTLGFHWAVQRGIKTIEYPADWDKHGRSAGFIRNLEMAKSGVNLLIAFPGGKGTAHMMNTCNDLGIPMIQVKRSIHD